MILQQFNQSQCEPYGLTLVKGNGVFFWKGTNEQVTFKLQQYATNNLFVEKFEQLPIDRWIHERDRVISDLCLTKLDN